MRDSAKTLAAVYETDYRKLVNAARVLVGFDAADELVQDAFARCVVAWRRGIPDDPHAYVRVVVLNLGRSAVRRAMYRRSVQLPVPTVGQDPDQRYQTSAVQRRLVDEVSGLPRRQRECVALRYLLELRRRDGGDARNLGGIGEDAHPSCPGRARTKNGRRTMTRDDDLQALADMPVHQPPFGEVTRRSARLQRRRRTAAAVVSVLAVVGAGIGISVSRDGDGDNVATVDPTVQPSIATTPQATVDHSPPDPAPTTPPEPTVVEPTPTSATGSTRCSGKAVDGTVIGAADVDGDRALDDIVAGQGPDGDPVMVAHNPATFGWTGGADLQGWIGAAVLGASALDESPGDEVFVDVGGNTAWNAAIVSMSDCQLSAVTTGEPPEVLLLLHGATGLSCMPTGCAARIRCADGHVIAEQASPAEAEEELDWYRTTYRIERSRAIEVSTEAGTATLSDLPFPRDQTVHCPVPQPALPSGFLGVTTQGEIVEVNTSDGVVGRSWGSLADPTVPLPPNAEIAPNYVDGSWRLGHSPFMYVSQCCEPAGGNILRVFDDLANAENSSGGWVGVPSPDGLATAFVDLTGAGVVITGVSGRRIEIGPARDSSVDTVPGGLSWLRDRLGVVWSTYSGDVRVIELDVSYEPVRDRALPELDPLHGVTVAARGDGVIVVAGCVEPDVGQQCPESRALVVDPDSGETLDELSVEPGTRLGGYDRTGTFLIYVDGAGTVRWTAGTDNGVIAEGYRWATW